jgi:hypothetical protein
VFEGLSSSAAGAEKRCRRVPSQYAITS